MMLAIQAAPQFVSTRDKDIAGLMAWAYRKHEDANQYDSLIDAMNAGFLPERVFYGSLAAEIKNVCCVCGDDHIHDIDTTLARIIQPNCLIFVGRDESPSPICGTCHVVMLRKVRLHRTQVNRKAKRQVIPRHAEITPWETYAQFPLLLCDPGVISRIEKNRGRWMHTFRFDPRVIK